MEIIRTIIIALIVLISAFLVFVIIYGIYKQREENQLRAIIERRRIEREKLIEQLAVRIEHIYDESYSELGLDYPDGDGDDMDCWVKIKDELYVFYILEDTLYFFESLSKYAQKYDIEKIADSELGIAALSKKPLEYIDIPVDSIESFAEEGDIKYTTEVSGGGGGGSSLQGAIIGGLIAGEAGAIIGSRQSINPITSETVSYDNRKTIIKYYKDKSLVSIVASGGDLYAYLLDKIPHKHLSSVQLQTNTTKSSDLQTNAVKSSDGNTEDISDKLTSLKKMLENGLIDEAEYNEKKKELLQRM